MCSPCRRGGCCRAAIYACRKTDTTIISLREERIEESEEARPGVIADFDHDGGVVRLEILDASKCVQEPLSVTLSTDG
jgi:uncharacterized protein YuzE